MIFKELLVGDTFKFKNSKFKTTYLKMAPKFELGRIVSNALLVAPTYTKEILVDNGREVERS